MARSSRIDGGCGRTHARTRGTRRTPRRTPRTQEHTQDTRTVSLTGRSNRPNRIHTKVERSASRYTKGSWTVVSPTANQADPIKSPEDERLASSQTTSRGLESTRGIFSTRGGLESTRGSSRKGVLNPKGSSPKRPRSLTRRRSDR